MMTPTAESLYIVETRSNADRCRSVTDGNWETDCIGDNAPRTRAECETDIADYCSPDCDWRRDAGAPHEYALRQVTAEGTTIRQHIDRRRDDAETFCCPECGDRDCDYLASGECDSDPV